jgi:hypothetical protein
MPTRRSEHEERKKRVYIALIIFVDVTRFRRLKERGEDFVALIIPVGLKFISRGF